MRTALCFAAAVCLTASLPAAAQTGTASRLDADNQNKPVMVQMMVTQVKPEMQREYESLLKDEFLPAMKKAGAPWVHSWQGALFGDQYMWVRVSPLENFASRDQGSPFVKALGEEAARNLIEKVRRCIVSSQSYAVAYRPDLSLQKETATPPNLAVVMTLKVTPGREPDFVRFMKNEILPVMRKAEVENYRVHQTVFGGDPMEWTTVMPIENYAELDKGSPMTRVLGQQGVDKLLAKAQGLATPVRRSITRHRADLSYDTREKK